MPRHFFLSTTGLVSLAFLTACSSGGGTSGTTAPTTGGGTTTPVGSYVALTSTTNTAVPITGQGIQFSEPAGTISLVTASGAINPTTGASVVSAGAVSVSDANGVNPSGVLEDDTGPAEADLSLTPSGYDYLVIFTADSDPANFTTYDFVIGTAGVGTNAADMPSSGTATFTGNSIVATEDASGNEGEHNGTSTVTVNYGSTAAGGVAAQSANITMGGFTSTYEDNLGNTITGVNHATGVTITGAGLSGATLSGGTIATTGGTLSVSGATTSLHQGNFYGLDAGATVAPDEVGGIFAAGGTSTGGVSGFYVAD